MLKIDVKILNLGLILKIHFYINQNVYQLIFVSFLNSIDEKYSFHSFKNEWKTAVFS